MLKEHAFQALCKSAKETEIQISLYCFLSLVGGCACQLKLDLVFVQPSKQERLIFSNASYEALTCCGRELIFLCAKTASNLCIKCRGRGGKQVEAEIHFGPDRSRRFQRFQLRRRKTVTSKRTI